MSRWLLWGASFAVVVVVAFLIVPLAFKSRGPVRVAHAPSTLQSLERSTTTVTAAAMGNGIAGQAVAGGAKDSGAHAPPGGIGKVGGTPSTGHHVIHHYHHSTHAKPFDPSQATPAPPPVPSPPPPPAADPFKSMDVEYRKPKALLFQVPAIFKLVIASHSVAEAHETLAPLHGQLVDTQVKLGNNVTSVLWGDPKTVDIASGDPPSQDVSASANRVWTWSVTPKTMRPIYLQLTIYAGDPSHGDDRLQYAETFKVQVHAADKVKNWIDDYDPIWNWLVAFVTTVAGAAAAVWRFFYKKKDPQPG